MSTENAITAGQSIGDAPQASIQGDVSGTPGDDLASTLAPDSQGAAEGETAEETAERMIHGMNAEDILKAMEDGVIPEELYEHLRIKMRVDGLDEEVPLNEHRTERMLINDYSRNMQKLKNERNDFERSRDAFAGMVDAWKNPHPMQLDKTLDELEQIGLPIHELTMIYAQRHTERKQLEESVPEGQRAMFRSLMQERDEMRRALKKLELGGRAPQQQQQNDPTAQVTRERLQRMAPAAFKKERLPEGDVTRNMFNQHLSNIWDRNTELTQEHVNRAAAATRQDIEKNLRQLGYGPVGQRAPGQQPPPRVAPAPGVQASVRRVAPQAPRGTGAPTNGAMNLDQWRSRGGSR